jgi:serpin B
MNVDKRLVVANIQFSFKLFLEIFKQDDSKNIFISPCSVAIALDMT